MAKRFTDTEKWGRLWFRVLPPKMKCAWEFIRDRCDHAGFWAVDFESLAFFVGEKISKEEFEEAFKGRVIMIEQTNRYLILGFASFQYLSPKAKEKALNPKNSVHASVISTFKLLAPSVSLDEVLGYPNIDPSKLFIRGSIAPTDKDTDKEKDTDIDTDKDQDTRAPDFNAEAAREDMKKLSGIKTPDDLIQYWNTEFVEFGFPPAPFTLGTEYSKKFFHINKRLLENKLSWQDYLSEIITSKFLLTRKIGKPAVTWVLDEANFDDVIAGKFKNPDLRAQAVADLHDLELN